MVNSLEEPLQSLVANSEISKSATAKAAKQAAAACSARGLFIVGDRWESWRSRPWMSQLQKRIDVCEYWSGRCSVQEERVQPWNEEDNTSVLRADFCIPFFSGHIQHGRATGRSWHCASMLSMPCRVSNSDSVDEHHCS